jgi:hypothetical protein
LPDGLFAGSAVQPHLQKYFRSRLNQIKTISLAVLSHNAQPSSRGHGVLDAPLSRGMTTKPEDDVRARPQLLENRIVFENADSELRVA